MESASDDRAQDTGMPFYGVGNDGYGDYSRMQDPSISPAFSQSWQNPPISTNPIAGWNHALQTPSRQHTPNNAPQFDHGNLSRYGDAYSNGLPSTSSYSWAAFNPSAPFGNSSLDPSLNDGSRSGNGLDFTQQPFHAHSAYQQTIAPSALEHVSTQQYSNPKPNGQYFSPMGQSSSSVAPQTTYQVNVPSGSREGNFSMIQQEALASVTNSKPLVHFLNLGVESQEFQRISRSATTPAAPRRKSRNAIRQLAQSDPKLLAKLAKGKKQAKLLKSQIKAQKIPAPRSALARTSSAVSTPSSVDSSSEDDSDYDSSDDELDIIESPPYANKRPDEPNKATAWDTTKAVWLPRRKQPTPDQIREALKEFWLLLSTIRNRWNLDGKALKEAEDAQRNSEIPMLKDRVTSQRTMLEAALSAALEHGHPEVIRLMGENRPFLQMCYLFLADRIKATDANGTLPRQLFKLLVRCTTITQEALEEFKLKKVFSMYTKRGDEETKKLIKQIEEVAVVASKEKAEKAKAEKTAEEKQTAVPTKPAAASTGRVPTPVAVAGVKRSATNDALSAPAKKPVPTATTSKVAPSAKGSPSTLEKKLVVNAASKPVIAGPAKTTNMYSSIKPSRKPGTSVIEKKITATAQATEKKAAAPVPAKAPAASGFSFKDYMADLSKPKEPEKPKEKKPERGPETEEQKRKRERKEARRSLRVQFKTGSALEEIRIFEHHPDEEIGHDASMTRDVGDVHSEGRMFKQHMEKMDLDGEMDMDIDDDDEKPSGEEKLIGYNAPSPVDFDDIEKKDRLTHYDKFGGYKQAVSKERELQDKHESTTLLAVYFSSADVPLNPREPADPYDGEHIDETRDFGAPPKEVLERAQRLAWQSAPTTWSMPASASASAPAAPSMSGTPALNPDINAILASLSSHGSTTPHPAAAAPMQQPTQQPIQQPGQTSAAPAGFENLFAIFQQHSNKEPETVQKRPEPVAQPAPQLPSADLGSILASLQGLPSTSQTVTPAPAVAPFPPPFPSMPLPISGNGTAPPVDFAAMMAAMAAAGMPPPPMPGMPSLPGFPPPMQQSSSNAVYEHPDRKRMFDGADDGDSDVKKGKWDNGGKKKWTKGEKPKWVLPCRYFKEGRCNKGDSCTYLHE